jgi:short-subunit dehydrogenase
MLSKKNVFITGASAGLGKALAMDAASRGAKLTLTARRIKELEDVKQDIIKKVPQAEILLIKNDVADKESTQQAVEESVAHFGRMDAFIDNAGRGMWSRFSDIDSPDRLKEIMDINFGGVVNGAFYALPHLRKTQGSFVVVSSIQGVIPVPFHTGYVASKFAVNGFIETLSLEEPNIHFLLGMPSWISGTELRAQSLVGQAKDSIVVKRQHGKSAITPEAYAKLLIDAMLAHKKRLFTPRWFGLIPFLRSLIPNTLDRITVNKVNTQVLK